MPLKVGLSSAFPSARDIRNIEVAVYQQSETKDNSNREASTPSRLAGF